MKVKKLLFRNFRNYERLEIEPTNGINLFLGPNAQGKTNIIEAVYYSALGRSHRTKSDNELIRWNEQQALVRLDFERADVGNSLEFKFHSNKRREIIYNGVPIAMKKLIGAINVVMFSPEDLFIVKGAPAGRRRFLDMEISQADPAYFSDLMMLTHIITQRNALLKKIRDEEITDRSMLELWSKPLAKAAASVVKKRLKSVAKLNVIANDLQKSIAGETEDLNISYEVMSGKKHEFDEQLSVDDMAEWYMTLFNEITENDIARGYTSLGPHRDDLKIEVKGVDLRTFGSQGQQRTGALALKLAELSFFKDETGEYPVLLLDDVMSELDKSRRSSLLDFLKAENIQTFITATDDAYFPNNGMQDRFQIYNVKSGHII